MGAKRSLLIIDDNFTEKILTERLLRDLQLGHEVFQALDGDAGLDFLKKQRPYENAPRPDLILLDLDLPGKHGCEVLRQIKGDLKLRSIPVIIVSASQKNEDVLACYGHYANAYIRKATDLDGALQLVSAIDQFWFQTIELMTEK